MNRSEQMNFTEPEEPELNQENQDNLESSEADLKSENTEDKPENKTVKPSLGRKIRKVTGIAGLSALSMLPSEKNNDLQSIDNDLFARNQTENKIEWERDDLENKEGSMHEMAYMLAEEEVINQEGILSRENTIDSYKESLEEAINELKYREEHGGQSKGMYSNLATEFLKKTIEVWKGYIIEDETELVKLKDSVHDQLKVSDVEINKQIEKINKSIFYYDLGRQWVLDNINNPDYFKRLEKEGFNTEVLPHLSSEEVEKYMMSLWARRWLLAHDDNFVISKDIEKSHGGDDADNTKAFYRPTNLKTYFPLDQDSLTSITLAIHEFTHKVTDANKRMTMKTIKLYGEAFDSSSVIANYGITKDEGGTNWLGYLSDPTEMNARKKVFDYDLERSGVKKYKEKFTKEHYLKAIRLEREGKLSPNSTQFIKSIKPEMMEKVMNEIADIDLNQEEVENIA